MAHIDLSFGLKSDPNEAAAFCYCTAEKMSPLQDFPPEATPARPVSCWRISGTVEHLRHFILMTHKREDAEFLDKFIEE